jgi:hypothetical protein
MSVKHLAFFAVSLCLLASCKKNKSSNANANPNKLKTYISSSTFGTFAPDTFLVSYDDENRLTALSGANSKYIYAYLNNTIVFDFYLYNQLSEHWIYYLNSTPMVDSALVVTYGNTFGNTPDTSTQGYVYNGNLLSKKLAYTYYNHVTYASSLWDDYTYDNNGDIVKDVEYYDSAVEETSTFTYTTYPVNVTTNPAYMPQQSKYLPATVTYLDGNGTVSSTGTYTYSFDSMNRLTKTTITYNNGQVYVDTYVYE